MKSECLWFKPLCLYSGPSRPLHIVKGENAGPVHPTHQPVLSCPLLALREMSCCLSHCEVGFPSCAPESKSTDDAPGVCLTTMHQPHSMPHGHLKTSKACLVPAPAIQDFMSLVPPDIQVITTFTLPLTSPATPPLPGDGGGWLKSTCNVPFYLGDSQLWPHPTPTPTPPAAARLTSQASMTMSLSHF
jgi:hypothetical protein